MKKFTPGLQLVTPSLFLSNAITLGKTVKVLAAQSCQNLCNPMDYNLPDSSPGKILEWVVIPFFRESSWSRDWTQVSYITGNFLYLMSYRGCSFWKFVKANLVEKSGSSITSNFRGMSWDSSSWNLASQKSSGNHKFLFSCPMVVGLA